MRQIRHWPRSVEQFPTWHDCINHGDRTAFFSSPDLERFPTWGEAVDDERNFFGERTANFSSPLEKWFGEDFNGMGGPGNYAQCVKYGIGREVIAKMLEGTETKLRDAPKTA